MRIFYRSVPIASTFEVDFGFEMERPFRRLIAIRVFAIVSMVEGDSAGKEKDAHTRRFSCWLNKMLVR